MADLVAKKNQKMHHAILRFTNIDPIVLAQTRTSERMMNKNVWHAAMKYPHVMTYGYVNAVQTDSWLLDEYASIIK
jgi:hypothetical protein